MPLVFSIDFLEKETNMKVLKKIFLRGKKNFEKWDNILYSKIYEDENVKSLFNNTNNQIVKMISVFLKKYGYDTPKIINIDSRWDMDNFLLEVKDYIGRFPIRFIKFYDNIDFKELKNRIIERRFIAKAWVYVGVNKIEIMNKKMKPIFTPDKDDFYDLICRQKPFFKTIFYSGNDFEKCAERTFGDLQDKIDLIFSIFHEFRHTLQESKSYYDFEEYKAYSYLYEIKNWILKEEVPIVVKNAGENDGRYFTYGGLLEEYEANSFAIIMTQKFLKSEFNFNFEIIE